MAGLKHSFASSILVVFSIIALLSPVPVKTQVANAMAVADPNAPMANVVGGYTRTDSASFLNLPAPQPVSASGAKNYNTINPLVNPNVPAIYSQGSDDLGGMALSGNPNSIAAPVPVPVSAPSDYQMVQNTADNVGIVLDNNRNPSSFTPEQLSELKTIIKGGSKRKRRGRKYRGMNGASHDIRDMSHEALDHFDDIYSGSSDDFSSARYFRGRKMRHPFQSAGAGFGRRKRRSSSRKGGLRGFDYEGDFEGADEMPSSIAERQAMAAFYENAKRKAASEMLATKDLSSPASLAVPVLETTVDPNVMAPKV